MKNFKLTEEQFTFLTVNTMMFRNFLISEMNKAEFPQVKEYYQKEIDKINSLLDELNLKFETSF